MRKQVLMPTALPWGGASTRSEGLGLLLVTLKLHADSVLGAGWSSSPSGSTAKSITRYFVLGAQMAVEEPGSGT